MTLRTRARGRAVMVPHDDGMKGLAAQSRLALVRPDLLQVLQICFSRRQCWMQGSLGLPAQQRTWGIAAISAGRCRRFGHRNLKRITMERIMTVKAWTREDSILPHPVGHDAMLLFPLSFHLILLFAYLPLEILQAPRRTHPHLSPRRK